MKQMVAITAVLLLKDLAQFPPPSSFSYFLHQSPSSLSRLSTSAQPGSYLTISTPSHLQKVGNERTNTAESSSNPRSQAATASPAEVARAAWQSRRIASQSTTENTRDASQVTQAAATGFQPSTPNTQGRSAGSQQADTSRTEQNLLRAPNSADPGAVQALTEFGAPSTSSHAQQNIGTAAQSNDSATVQSMTEGGVDFGSQIRNLRIAESDIQLRNTDLHLAPVTNIHRAEDGLVVIRITSPDRERPTIITLRNIRPSEAIDAGFIREDTTQVEPEAVNNGVSQDSEAASVISQPIQSSREAVVAEPIIPSRSVGPDHISVDGAEGVEVILPDRTSRPYELSLNQNRQADTTSGTVTIASPNAQREEGAQCSICFEILTTRSTLMPCGHEFDANCILTWFQAVLQENNPLLRSLDCPLCRQSTTLMRHSYDPQGDYRILNIHSQFFRPDGRPRRGLWPVQNSSSVPRPRSGDGHNVASSGDLEPADSRGRYVLGQFRTFFITSDHPDRLILDMERVDMTGPHELEDLISELRSNLSHFGNRLPGTQIQMLVDRISAFRSLSSDGPFARVNYIPGYNSDDSLNINEINRMSPEDLSKFINVLIHLGEFERLSDTEIVAFFRIYDEARRLENTRGNGGQNATER